jgi:predicted enzyme related to lactoylglutathione lyase
MIVLQCYTDGREIPDARAHGPAGFATDDMDATHAAVVAAGATPKGPVIVVEGGIKVAFLNDPEGHEIELCQFG